MMLPRIVVVGTTGSGKTTVARRLARSLALPHVELDVLNYHPHGFALDVRDTPEFRRRVAAALDTAHGWVADGNYVRSVGDLVWPKATALVWLDYPLRTVLRRLLLRTIGRIRSGELLASGERETVRHAFLRRDFLLLQALGEHGRRRRTFPQALARRASSGAKVFRHRSPRDTQQWLEAVEVGQVDLSGQTV